MESLMSYIPWFPRQQRGHVYIHLPQEEKEENKPQRCYKESRPLSAIRVDFVVDKVDAHEQPRCLRPAVFPVCIIVIITSLVVVLPLIMNYGIKLRQGQEFVDPPVPCSDQCSVTIVESIPVNLTYPAGSPQLPSIFDSWMQLISLAQETIEIGAFYFTLRGEDIHFEDPSAAQGEQVFKRLMDIGSAGKVKIRIAQNLPSKTQHDQDTIDLAKSGGAEVRSLDFQRFEGAGILHTKVFIVDRKHFFVGSANMDWRSLTQVKELGAAVYNCSCLAQDIGKIFDAYWYMGAPNSTIPPVWPKEYNTAYNATNPMSVPLNGTETQTYLASSPPEFCPAGRSVDIDAILNIINQSREFVYIAVMDYFPSIVFSWPNKFWPVIDDALRAAALNRRVRVRLLASWWKHSNKDMIKYLQSLQALNGTNRHTIIETKLFEVPATPEQAKIPYARVNHNKYMVTDKTAYIGTSNWSGDYFVNTGGIGFVLSQNADAIRRGPMMSTQSTIEQQLKDVFDRDWNSPYARPITDFTK
ncbi:5'-3' exonuclease PLD3-like isoform X2 [Lineus longissimus]